MIILRSYQNDAINAIFSYFERANGNPLISMNVGTGKSVVIAGFCKRIFEYDKHATVMITVSRKELVAQNHGKLIAIAPELDIGIFSSGLGKRQRGRSITFCGIQSIYKRAFEFGKIDILIVDEVHEIPLSEKGIWHKLIGDLKIGNPDLRIVGFTGTPYRSVEGSLVESEGALFDEIVYETNLIDMIERGYLCPITNRKTETRLSASGVAKRNGDYIESQLQKAVDIDELTKACVEEIVESGADRKKWLVFASGIDHAIHIRDAIREHGITCETVSGKTPKAERDEIIVAYKRGEIRCVTQINVLSTGFDAPDIDLIGFMRPTTSPIIWSQGLGRGLRTCEGKVNCLLRDFTDNTAFFGPLDKIRAKDKRTSRTGTAPSKLCGVCFALCPASVMTCADCGHVFPGSGGPNLNRRASEEVLLSNQVIPITYQVKMVSYFKHQKDGKLPSLRVDYLCGLKRFSEWIAFESLKAEKRSSQWWNKFGGNMPSPKTVDEALSRKQELKMPEQIIIRKEGQYDRVYHTNSFRHLPITIPQDAIHGMGS